MGAVAIIVTASAITYSEGQVGAGCMPEGHGDLQYQGPQFIRDKIKSHKTEVQNITHEMSMGRHNTKGRAAFPPI